MLTENGTNTERAESVENTESSADLGKTNGVTNNLDPEEVCHDYEDVLSLIGFGKTQWVVLFTSGFLLMMVINETMGMSIITIASQCDFATTSVDKAIMSAACFIGILCSSYFWGYLSDTIGRRAILIYTTLGGNGVSLLSMFIPNFWLFVAFRFFVGFFIAGASSTTYAYLGEFFIPRHRPIVINYASMFVGLSMAYVPAVAWLVLSMTWELWISDSFVFRPWRLLILFNLLPGFIASLVLLALPESPKLLLAVSKEDEAMAAVEWICQQNRGQSLAEIKVYKLKHEKGAHQENVTMSDKNRPGLLCKMWQDTRPLFKRPHVVNFLISCIVMCGLFFSSSGMGLWFPEIQNRLGTYTNGELMSVCQVIDASIQEDENRPEDSHCNDAITNKSYMDSITFGLSYFTGFLILGVVLHYLGRKKVIVGALCASSLCGLSLLWLLDPIGIVVSFCLYLVLPGLCISVLSGAVVDLVPTHLRGKAVCICLMLGRSGSVIGSNIIGILLESYCVVTFSVFSGFVLVCAALTFMLPI